MRRADESFTHRVFIRYNYAIDVTIEVGSLKSEFAVFANEVRVFSRLEQRRFSETDELVEICNYLVVTGIINLYPKLPKDFEIHNESY